MKYLSLIVLLLVFSCSNNENKASAADDDVEWKEMDEFHEVMADVYHPLKDSNDLEPIKKDAGRLTIAAEKWAQSAVPDKVNNDETKDLLAQLEDGCQQLKRLVNDKASDEEIATKLTAQHETFHTIMENFYRAGKEEGAEEHHDH